MKRLLTPLVAAATLTIASSVAAPASNLRLLSSWSSSNKPLYAMAENYVKNVHEIGGGKIKITISGPEVVPPFEQLQPVMSGAFDMLFTHAVYHAGSKGLALVIDALEINPVKRRQVGIFDFVDKYYQKNHNLKLLSMQSASFFGYHLFVKQPLGPDGDLKGRKIRATQSYFGVIEALGGKPVVLPPAEIYSALEKGVVDGSAWPAAGMLDMKHHEVAKYRLRPTFGYSTEPVWINLDRWKKLSPEEQKILLDAGYKAELEMPWIGNDIQAKEDEALARLGVQDIQLSEEKAAKIKKAWSDSLWQLAKTCCGEGADGLHELAKKNGLTF
jgi:TRAP-type transport system periplasmic protein